MLKFFFETKISFCKEALLLLSQSGMISPRWKLGINLKYGRISSNRDDILLETSFLGEKIIPKYYLSLDII